MRRLAWKWILGAVVALLVGVETAVRLSGVIDFPLYVANSEIGYIPAPSQKGAFLGRNEWIFNEFSMGSGAFSPSANAVDTLLIGDSIVLGGNPYRQQDKLGPVLSELYGASVWPISAGSWALRNELKYLKLNQRVTRNIDRFVFVLNAEDFAAASSWACERTHPRQRPWSAALYLFRKQVWDWDDCKTVAADLAVAAGDWKADLREFLTSPEARNKPVSFYLYPQKKELAAADFSEVEQYAEEILLQAKTVGVSVAVYSVGRDERWGADWYADSIHPSPKGIKVLAEVIASPSRRAVMSPPIEALKVASSK